MFSRRKFLALGVAFPAILRGADKPLLRLGLIADPQYADIPYVATRHYRKSIDKLGVAVEHFNGQELDLCVNAGDTIDKDWASFDEILKPLSKLRHKVYHVLGNHDFEVLDAEKARVAGRLGMEGRYYSVSREGLCLVFLDTNDISLYGQPAKARETLEAFEELKKYAATGIIHAQTWNGAVGHSQITWLEDTCRKALEEKQKVIIFAHHPIFPFPNNRNAWNSDAMLELVGRHKNIVAWINGHNHFGGYGLRHGVHFITLHGMVETSNTNAYSTALILNDRLQITGHGREPSRELLFRSA